MQRRPETRLVSILKDRFENDGCVVAAEQSLGYGRADLVAFRIDPEKCHARLANGQLRSLDRVEHYTVLRHLPDANGADGISADDLARRLGRSPGFVRGTLLRFLERAGYVQRPRPNLYARVNGFIPIAREVIAVEAKVSDWRKGAIQAKRYHWFADRVYLALAAEYIHRVQTEVLTRHGIGLLSVGSDEVNEILSAPALGPLDPDRHSFAA